METIPRKNENGSTNCYLEKILKRLHVAAIFYLE
jgi:hypothetical protein